MLGSIRKFSSSIYAKVFLFIVALPFVFWGMGDVFTSGNQNTIAKIDNEKISTKDFVEYINYYSNPAEDLNDSMLEKILSTFIGEKLIEKEIKNLKINLSKNSLSKLIKNENIFNKNGKFSRTEYEKFLISNGLTAVTFEKNMLRQSKKKQLLDFVSGGVIPTNFLINVDFNKINQKRNIQIININDVINKKKTYSENEVVEYFQKNKNKYVYTYKTINFTEINPLNLTGSNEFGDLFFEKIDQIDDYIVEGEDLKFISKEFNLDSLSKITFDKFGKNKKGKAVDIFPKKLIENIFSQEESSKTILTINKNKYFIFEIMKIENIQKNLNDDLVKENVIKSLKINSKRKFTSDLINKINSNKFNKFEFDKLSKEENVNIRKISIKNQDDKVLSENLIQQIYSYPEKKVILVADISLSEVYLVYIDKIENVSINKESKDYAKYSKLSKIKMIENLYTSYDSYLKKKYEVEINYNAFENLKNNIK